MRKELKTGLKSILIILLAALTLSLFGRGEITDLILKKVLFTPYNIVGIIMSIVTIFGYRINKKQGHWLKLTLTILIGIVTVFPFVCTICSWFNVNLLNLIWVKVLKPATISVLTVLMWIVIVIVCLSIIGFMIYELIQLICNIKEKIKSKTDQKDIEKQIDKKENIPITEIHDSIQNDQQADFVTTGVETEENPVGEIKAQLKEKSRRVILPKDYERIVSRFKK